MKSYYTPPKNQQFFQSYHRLTPTLRLMGYLAQVITALAEMGISYQLILSSVQEVFPEHAVPAAIFGAVAACRSMRPSTVVRTCPTSCTALASTT